MPGLEWITTSYGFFIKFSCGWQVAIVSGDFDEEICVGQWFAFFLNEFFHITINFCFFIRSSIGENLFYLLIETSDSNPEQYEDKLGIFLEKRGLERGKILDGMMTN